MGRSNDSRLRVGIIVGSIRDGRFGPVVADWLVGQMAQREDMSVDLIDLAETPLPMVFPVFGQPPVGEVAELLAAVSPRLEAADALVIVTPEYNHSFPASLKNAIDWHNQQWHAKPVGFVSYGGLSGGLRAVEQLRVVLAELHTVTIRNTVSFHNYGEKFDADGQVVDPRPARPRPRPCSTSWPGGRGPCGMPRMSARTPSDVAAAPALGPR